MGWTKVWNSTIAGFLQLAGGTNAHTVHAMRAHGFCEETLGNIPFSQGFLLESNYEIMIYGSTFRVLLLSYIYCSGCQCWEYTKPGVRGKV